METDFLIEEVSQTIPRQKQTTTFYNQSYVFPSGIQEIEETRPKFITHSGVNAPTTIGHGVFTSPTFASSQGVLSLDNFSVSLTEFGLKTSGYLARWNSSQGFAIRGVIGGDFGQIIWGLLWAGEASGLSSGEQPRKFLAGVQFPEQVLVFCSRYQVFGYLLSSLKLAEEFFLNLNMIELTTENDPELGDEWIVIVVHTAGEVANVLDSYDAYSRRFAQTVPWPASIKIRLIYNLV